MVDTLAELIRSTAELYARFGHQPSYAATLRVFQEEVGELIEAVEQGTDKRHMAEEAADVVVTAIGMCLAAGVDGEQIIAQAQAVVRKNDAKTHETHAIDENGKIARKR